MIAEAMEDLGSRLGMANALLDAPGVHLMSAREGRDAAMEIIAAAQEQVARIAEAIDKIKKDAAAESQLAHYALHVETPSGSKHLVSVHASAPTEAITKVLRYSERAICGNFTVGIRCLGAMENADVLPSD